MNLFVNCVHAKCSILRILTVLVSFADNTQKSDAGEIGPLKSKYPEIGISLPVGVAAGKGA